MLCVKALAASFPSLARCYGLGTRSFIEIEIHNEQIISFYIIRQLFVLEGDVVVSSPSIPVMKCAGHTLQR
jgi:hypothetical protein